MARSRGTGHSNQVRSFGSLSSSQFSIIIFADAEECPPLNFTQLLLCRLCSFFICSLFLRFLHQNYLSRDSKLNYKLFNRKSYFTTQYTQSKEHSSSYNVESLPKYFEFFFLSILVRQASLFELQQLVSRCANHTLCVIPSCAVFNRLIG